MLRVIFCLLFSLNLWQVLPSEDEQLLTLPYENEELLTMEYEQQLSPQRIEEKSESMKTFRRRLRMNNEQIVQEHNEQQNKSYQLESNDFSELTESEINQFVLNLFPSSHKVVQYAKSLISPNEEIIKSGSSPGQIYNRADIQGQLLPEEVFPTSQDILSEIKQILEGRNISKEKIEQTLHKSSNLSELQTFRSYSRRLQQEPEREEFNVDWTCMSGSIRRQGKCGACYAFAPADALSAIYSIYVYSFFVSFSPQEIVDCAKNNMAAGCQGGFLEGSYTYMRNYGIKTQYDYPYVNKNNSERIQACQNIHSHRTASWRIRDFVVIEKGNCLELKRMLQHHPISVGIAGRALLFYRRGVVENCDKLINHAVLLVGYQQGKGWKYKNSWGTRWGENGYGWVGEENNCQVCQMARYPTLDSLEAIDYDKKKRTCPNP